jgi:Capsule polysaccharide biosynthesis protein.
LIYTINSTVGLESLILGKEVIVLGKAIYSAFDTEMLKKYIHSYLIDFDYFSKNEFEASHLVKLTKLSEL